MLLIKSGLWLDYTGIDFCSDWILIFLSNNLPGGTTWKFNNASGVPEFMSSTMTKMLVTIVPTNNVKIDKISRILSSPIVSTKLIFLMQSIRVMQRQPALIHRHTKEKQ